MLHQVSCWVFQTPSNGDNSLLMVAAAFRFQAERLPFDKVSVQDRLPPQVQAHCERFSTCDGCGRVCWDGSHWRNMRRLLDEWVPNKQTGGTE